MRLSLPIAALAALGMASSALAYKTKIKDTDEFREVCTGMYGGSDAFVEVSFDGSSEGQVSLVIYEWEDAAFLGAHENGKDTLVDHPKTYICTTSALGNGLCTTDQLGQFIITLPPGRTINSTSIFTAAIKFDSPPSSGNSAKRAGGKWPPEALADADKDKNDAEAESDIGDPPANGGHLSGPAEAAPPAAQDDETSSKPEVHKPVDNEHESKPQTQTQTGGSSGSGGTGGTIAYIAPIHYLVPKTGYYCVGVVPITLVSHDRRVEERQKSNVHGAYSGEVLFRNQFQGELPASEYPKIGFYGLLSIVYVLLAIGWGILCARHYHELLPMQYYISGTIVFLVIEMLALFAYYRFINKHGQGGGSTAFLILISVLNAARNSLSFFLLLIVAMGLSVVTPSLGTVMHRVWLLTGFHFVFGVMYAVGTVKVQIDSAALIMVIMFIFPLALTLTAFLMWIIISLNGTILHLQQRKQNFKLSMFQNLWRILIMAVIAVAAFFVISSISLSNRLDEDYAPRTWKYRWVLLDASLALIYLAVFASIAWLWRPTENNVRFAMSTELAQDEADAEDYEIDALAQHRPEGLALEPDSDYQHIHGEPGTEDERKRLYDGPSASGGGGARREIHDDNVVFAMGDDSEEDSDDDDHEGTHLKKAGERDRDRSHSHSGQSSRRSSGSAGRFRDSVSEDAEEVRRPKDKAD